MILSGKPCVHPAAAGPLSLWDTLAKLLQDEIGKKKKKEEKLQLPASHGGTQQQTRGRRQLGAQESRGLREEERGAASSHIDGGFHRGGGGRVTARNPPEMAKNQEVERIAKKLDKMVHKKNTVSGRHSGCVRGEQRAIRWWALPGKFWKHRV